MADECPWAKGSGKKSPMGATHISPAQRAGFPAFKNHVLCRSTASFAVMKKVLGSVVCGAPSERDFMCSTPNPRAVHGADMLPPHQGVPSG